MSKFNDILNSWTPASGFIKEDVDTINSNVNQLIDNDTEMNIKLDEYQTEILDNCVGGKNQLEIIEFTNPTQYTDLDVVVQNNGEIIVKVLERVNETHWLIFTIKNVPSGSYILSGTPSDNNGKLQIQLYYDRTIVAIDTGSGVNCILDNSKMNNFNIQLRFAVGTLAGYTAVFKPMLRKSNVVSPTFVPHIPTNNELIEMKVDKESGKMLSSNDFDYKSLIKTNSLEDAIYLYQNIDVIKSIMNSTTTQSGTKTIVTTGDIKMITGTGTLSVDDVSGAKEVILDEGITSVGTVFKSNTTIESVVLSDSVTSIGERAFYGCSKLTTITLSESITSINMYTFYGCKALTSITIPDSVTSIGGSSFYNCSGLTSITIPDSVTSIGGNAFRDCTKLTSITLGSSVTTIGTSAFYNCKALTSITLPDSLTTINTNAFTSCAKLASITIPDSVTTMGDAIFIGCTALTSVTIGKSLTTIGTRLFTGCSKLTSITVNSSNPKYYSENNCIIERDTKTLIEACYTSIIPNDIITIGDYAFYDREILTITIPNSVTTIGYGVFYNCSKLASVAIPDSVTSIGEAVFDGCVSLTRIEIPDSVTTIGTSAFYGCSSLESITIPDSVTSIGNYTFAECSSLTSVTIPNSVTSIGTGAFRNCKSLTNITIPNSITSIGSDAFKNCTSLTTITINKPQDSISGAPWSAPNATVVWNG